MRQAFRITFIFYFRLNAGLTLTTLKVVNATTNIHLPKEKSFIMCFRWANIQRILKTQKKSCNLRQIENPHTIFILYGGLINFRLVPSSCILSLLIAATVAAATTVSVLFWLCYIDVNYFSVILTSIKVFDSL